MRPAPPRSDGQIRTVQVLRALAALVVVVFHATVLWHDRASPVPVREWENGNAGVDLFFVISGFIMVVSSRRLAGRPDGARRFIEYRLIRIVPLYWLATAAKLISMSALPSLALHSRTTIWNTVASFLFIPSRNGFGVVEPVVDVGWTLSFEMLFYAGFTLALAGALRPAVLVTCLLGPLALLSLVPLPDTAIATLANPIVLEFVFGMAVAELFLAGRLQALPRPAAAALLIVGLAVLALVPTADPWRRTEIWGIAAALSLAGALGLEAVLGPRLPRLAIAIGEASYALYLFHGFVLPPLGLVAIKARLGPESMGWFLVVASLICSTVAALLIYRLVERPAILWLRRQIGGGRPAEMAPTN